VNGSAKVDELVGERDTSGHKEYRRHEGEYDPASPRSEDPPII
jgi:hypothetical protein